jgi:Tol biopolymer transport system component
MRDLLGPRTPQRRDARGGPFLCIIAAAATIVAALSMTSTALGATNGRIAFQANVGRFPQIFTILPDGTGLKQVTRVAAKDPGAENPSWSPDGTTIAFDGAVATGVNLFTVAPDSSRLAELPLGVGAFNGDPAHSPDGTRISFDQDVGDSQPTVHGIFIANVDGTGARRLTTGLKTKQSFDTESQWSPDGTRIAFTRVKKSHLAAVFAVKVDGTGLERLTPWKLDAASPDWSPDGKTIVFNSYFDAGRGQSANLFAMRPDGSHRTALTHYKGGQGFAFQPSWAPDGTRIVFTNITPHAKAGIRQLWTMSPKGTHRKRLTNLPKKYFPYHADWGTAP